MKCEFCKKYYKDEFLSNVKIDQGEKVLICNDCECKLIKCNEN